MLERMGRRVEGEGRPSGGRERNGRGGRGGERRGAEWRRDGGLKGRRGWEERSSGYGDDQILLKNKTILITGHPH